MKPVIFMTQGGANLPSVRFRVLPYVDNGRNAGKDILWYRIPKSPFSRIKLFYTIPRSENIILQKKLLSPFFFKLLKQKCRKLFYDFDDAVWTEHSSRLEKNTTEGFRRKTWKQLKYVCRHSSGIIAGNSYLANRIKRYNKNVTVLPTPIDTDKYIPNKTGNKDGRFVVGWMGTAANQYYLNGVVDEVCTLKSDVEFQIVSNKMLSDFDQLAICFDPWSPEKEVMQLNRFTVGLMPLTDDEYSRGKCGFKLLQYMSCGVVPLASDVGFNRDIITHEKDGFLIREQGEWIKYLTRLKENKALQQEMSHLAREKIKKDFSLDTAARTLWHTLRIDDIG